MAVAKIATISRWLGLSSDTKPPSAPVGSTFKETDTKDYYVTYDDGTSWTKRARNSEADSCSEWQKNRNFT